MLAAMAICFFGPFVQVTAREGLMNGDFELVLSEGTMRATTSPPTGAFWAGGEGNVATFGGSRALRLDASDPLSAVAYQRVAARYEGGYPITAKLTGCIWIEDDPGVLDEEARISLSSGTGQHWSLRWPLRGPKRGPFYHDGDKTNNVLTRWVAQEVVAGGSPVPMTHDEANGVFISGMTPNLIAENTILLETESDGYMEVIYTVPHAGRIRILNRPSFAEPGPSGEGFRFIVACRKPPSSWTTLIDETIVAGDLNGPMIVLARDGFDPDDEIRIRWQRTTTNDLLDIPLRLRGHPVVMYEGSTFTYRLGETLPPNPVGEDESFEIVSTALGDWVPFSLDIGSKLHNHICQGFPLCPNDITPPLDLKLTATKGAVRFDDLSLTVEWPDVTAEELRELLLDEAYWQRDSVLGLYDAPGEVNEGVLDHDDFGDQRGPRSSFYQAHILRIDSGAELIPTNGADTWPGQLVEGLWPRLKASFNKTDHEHFFETIEPRFDLGNLSPVDFIYPRYDVDLDQYVTAQAGYPNGLGELFQQTVIAPAGPVAPIEDSATASTYADLVEWFRHTNDPVLLDRAFEAALTFVTNGVLEVNPGAGLPDRYGFVAHRAYDIEDGLLRYPSDVEAMDDQFGPEVPTQGKWYTPRFNMASVGPLIEIYTYARIFAFSCPGRYDGSDLQLLKTSLATAVEKGIDNRIPQQFPAYGGAWALRQDQTWHQHKGTFNDVFGNQGEDLLRAYLALQALEALLQNQTPPEDLEGLDEEMRDNIREYWLSEGTQFYYQHWLQAIARGGFAAGDYVRGFPMYLQVIQDPDISIPTGSYTATKDDFAQLLFDTAKYAMKFQYGSIMPGDVQIDGRWSTIALEDYQLPDIASKQTAPAANYLQALGFAMEAGTATGNLTPEQNDELRAYFAGYVDANDRHFKSDYGYHNNFAKTPNDPQDRISGRTIGAYLQTLEGWGDEVFDPSSLKVATPLITPTNCLHKTGNGPLRYFFRLTFEAPYPVQADRVKVLNDQTEIYYWVEDGSGNWEGTKIWPEIHPHNNPLGDPTFPTNNSVELKTTNDQLPPGSVSGGRFKYVMVTWDEEGRWAQDTSFQDN